MASQDDVPLRLLPGRDGIMVGEQRYEGFPDLQELPRESRVKVARWAQRLAPSRLTDYQRLLLEVDERAGHTRAAEELSGYARNLEDLLELHQQGLIDQLTAAQRRCLADPSSHPKLRGRGYPLTVGDLRDLTGATDRQIRHWADQGLLPNERIGNKRSFYSGALARAFLLAEADQHEKSAVSALTQGGEQATRVARLVASALLAGARDMPLPARDEVTKAAQSLLKHSRALGDHVQTEVRKTRAELEKDAERRKRARNRKRPSSGGVRPRKGQRSGRSSTRSTVKSRSARTLKSRSGTR